MTLCGFPNFTRIDIKQNLHVKVRVVFGILATKESRPGWNRWVLENPLERESCCPGHTSLTISNVLYLVLTIFRVIDINEQCWSLRSWRRNQESIIIPI